MRQRFLLKCVCFLGGQLVSCSQAVGTAGEAGVQDVFVDLANSSSEASECSRAQEIEALFHQYERSRISTVEIQQSATYAVGHGNTLGDRPILSADFLDPEASANRLLLLERQSSCLMVHWAGRASVDAGIVTVSYGGTRTELAPILGSWGASYSQTLFGQTSLWHPGDRLVIVAGGGVVPAFETSLIFPGEVALHEPAQPSANAPVELPRSSLQFRWEANCSSTIEVRVTWSPSQNETAMIRCFFRGDQSHGEVPRALVDRIPPSGAEHITVSSASYQTVQAGRFSIRAQSRVFLLKASLRFRPTP